MAYASLEARDKAVEVKQREVDVLTAKVENQTNLLARTQRALAIAQADLEHRKTAPVAPPVSLVGL